jgi:hypothetical protein
VFFAMTDHDTDTATTDRDLEEASHV